MAATVEGGTAAQQRLLREILAGLGDTSIELIRLEDWVDDFEEHPSLGLVPTQEEIDATRGTCVRLVAPDPAGLRADWEISLAADAFEYRSADEGLPPVVWLQVGSQHGGIVSGWRRSQSSASRTTRRLGFSQTGCRKRCRRDRRRIHGCHRRYRCGGDRRPDRAHVRPSSWGPKATPVAVAAFR